MAAIPWTSLAAAVLFLGVDYFVRVVRWWLMLRAGKPELRLRTCVWPLLASVAVNNVIPFRAGDALRVVGFRKQLDSPPARVLATLVAERILDLTVLLALFFLGVAGVRTGAIPPTYIHLCVAVACIGLLAWVVALLFARRLQTLLLRLCEHRALATRGWTQPAREHMQQFLGALAVLRTPVLTMNLFGLSMIAWTCEGGVFATIADGLGYSGSAFAPWFATAAGTLATLIPSSPGYVGTFDFFTMAALSAYGATGAIAGAFALLVHTVLWLPLTVAGLSYFLLFRGQGESLGATLAHQEDPR